MNDAIIALGVAIGLPVNAMAIVAAFWLIDRRLVKIETVLHMRQELAGAMPFTPCPQHPGE